MSDELPPDDNDSETNKRRPRDTELARIERIVRELDDAKDANEQTRIMTYLMSRFGGVVT